MYAPVKEREPTSLRTYLAIACKKHKPCLKQFGTKRPNLYVCLYVCERGETHAFAAFNSVSSGVVAPSSENIFLQGYVIHNSTRAILLGNLYRTQSRAL